MENKKKKQFIIPTICVMKMDTMCSILSASDPDDNGIVTESLSKAGALDWETGNLK